MKRILLLSLLLSASLAQAATVWTVPAFSYAFVRPANAGSSCSYRWEGTGGLVSGPTAAFSSGGPGAGTRTGTRVSVSTSLPDSVTSVRLTIMLNTTDGSPDIPVYWQQAYKASDPKPPKGGPYDNGVPETPDGDPVNSDGDPEAPPAQRHKARASYTNLSNYPKTVKEVWMSEGSLVKQKQTSCPPQSTYDTGWCYYHKPFTIVLSVTADGEDLGEDPVIGDSDPVNEADPDPEDPPLPDVGQPGGPGGPGSGGGGVTVNPTPEPPAVTPEPRPGAGEANDEARHKELVGAVNRTTTAANQAGNQAKSDAAQGNSLLGGIKDGISDLAGKMGEGEGEGDGFGPDDSANLDKLANEGPGEADSPGEAESAEADGIRGSVGALIASFSGLANALQVTGPGGGTSLSWTIEMPIGGTRTLSLEAYSGYFATVRTALRWVCTVIFAFAYIRVVRGAFA